MDKIRIAYIHATYAYYIAYQHLREELDRMATVKFYSLPRPWEENDPPLWDARDIVKEFNPDAIVIDVNNTVHRAISYMEDVNCLKIMMSDDPHNWLERQARFMDKARIDIMLMMNYGNWHGDPATYPTWWLRPFTLNSTRPPEIYGGRFTIAEKYQRQLSYPCKFIFFPESVNVNFFRDQGLERNIDVFNSGSFSAQTYPFRCKIHAAFNSLTDSRMKNIRCRITPSFAFSWEKYAENIARSKILAEGVGIFGYTSQRFTQAMASKTLVCSSLPFDNLENYFVPDSNFVLINENDFVDRIIYYLEHEDERKKIVENAYETILKHHTSEIRAKQLIDIIKEGLT